MEWEMFEQFRTEEERERDAEETRRAFFQATDEAVEHHSYNNRMFKRAMDEREVLDPSAF